MNAINLNPNGEFMRIRCRTGEFIWHVVLNNANNDNNGLPHDQLLMLPKGRRCRYRATP